MVIIVLGEFYRLGALKEPVLDLWPRGEHIEVETARETRKVPYRPISGPSPS